MNDLIASLHPLERKVAPHLHKKVTFQELIEKTGLKDIEVMRALQWMSNKKLVELDKKFENAFVLDKYGLQYIKNNLPEYIFLDALTKEFVNIDELVEKIKFDKVEVNTTIGQLKRMQFIEINKGNKGLEAKATELGLKNQKKENQYIKLLKKIEKNGNEDNFDKEELKLIQELSKRKQLVKKETKREEIIKVLKLGEDLAKSNLDEMNFAENLTSDMLKTEEWKNITFRNYDVESKVPSMYIARRHPVNEVHNLIRDVFVGMGFQEMEGPLVETAFWCMDSMWIPQDHPARDVQDTFFTGLKGKLPKKELVKKVKEVHENGGDSGSTGYQKPWDEEKAKELILRTHSTAATFRQFGLNDVKDISKYFYIATNFRNEATDATHLAEFVQVEGFVIGDNLGLPHLMGMIKEFYARLGITKIRFKPTYNPYTEPSMEAHYYDEKKKKWYALINSGIFRPESLAPYGIKKTIIAWGMGGTRVAALLNNINSPKEMVGAGVNFDWIQNHKIPQPKLD